MRSRGEHPGGSEPEGNAEWARAAAVDIWTHLVSRDFAGWDPYDALNTSRLPQAVTSSRLARRVLTQASKRSPLPLQPLLGVKPQVDAYALGHVLLAAARLNGIRPPVGMAQACVSVFLQLQTMAQAADDRLGWGYHFPVHTRFFSYLPPTPNLIVTAFVAKGLAAATRAGLLDAATEVQKAAAFILGGLPRVSDETGQCIGYLPGETAVVHNANMLAALVLCEAAELRSEAAALVDEALACARFTVARQAADGSWPYSEEPYGRWVDGFHTGFVLEGLARVVRTTGDEELRAALDRGVRFYVTQLFGPAGEPKYYPHRAYPLDVLSAAQGVETLQVAIGGHVAQAVPGQLEWIRRHLVKPGGRVAYQRHHGWTDRRDFPRWSSAPLMSALAGVGDR